jgi:hypothetical protein
MLSRKNYEILNWNVTDNSKNQFQTRIPYGNWCHEKNPLPKVFSTEQIKKRISKKNSLRWLVWRKITSNKNTNVTDNSKKEFTKKNSWSEMLSRKNSITEKENVTDNSKKELLKRIPDLKCCHKIITKY